MTSIDVRAAQISMPLSLRSEKVINDIRVNWGKLLSGWHTCENHRYRTRTNGVIGIDVFVQTNNSKCLENKSKQTIEFLIEFPLKKIMPLNEFKLLVGSRYFYCSCFTLALSLCISLPLGWTNFCKFQQHENRTALSRKQKHNRETFFEKKNLFHYRTNV